MNPQQLAQTRQTPRYATLGLIAQALKFCYQDEFEAIMKPTTKGGKALPNRAGQLADQLNTLCRNDVGKLGKLIAGAGVDDGPLYRALWDAQELIGEMVLTAMELSERTHQQHPEAFTFGVVELREMLRSIRAGEVAQVDPKQFEGMVRTGMLHPIQP